MLILTARNIRNFWRKVQRRGLDDCWPWIGGCSGDGYGAFGVDGHQHNATHIALTLDGRPRPAAPNDHALHGECSDPQCVNPRHLRWGSPQENTDDKHRLGRARYLKGEESGNAKLSEVDVRFIRSSLRRGKDLAAAFQVSPATISLIKNRKIWTHLS